MLISLIQNVSLLLAMAFLYDLAVSSRVPGLARGDVREGSHRWFGEIATGLVLGAIGIAVMASSWQLRDGVILDTRSAMLTAVGLFFGPVPAVCAVVVTSAYRWYLGGAGAPTGISVIVATTLVGLAARARLRDRLSHVRWYEFVAVGVIAHVVMLAMFVIVRFEGSDEVVREIAVPVLVIYPIAFTLVGVLLSRRRRAAELTQRVAESEANYRTVFENDHLVMIVIDPVSGRILDVNHRACEYYGYSRDDMLEMTTSDLEVLPRDEVIRQIDDGRAAGKTSFEFQHRLASGELRDVEVIGGAVTIGGETRVHTVVNDITDRKRAEREIAAAQEQLRHAQKMEAVGRLAGGVAHDFNNMLQVITGYTDVALAELRPDSELAEYLGEVRRAADRSSELTQQLLAFARRQTATPKVVRVDRVVETAARMLRRLVGTDVQVTWSSVEEPWRARLDPGQLEQVLANLALNARAAMPTGGRFTIDVRNETLGAPEPDDPPEARAGDHVVITVSDDGAGIPAEQLPYVFEPFFTTRGDDGGTGLGLSIVYGIVTQHGGFVTVHSEPGHGTEFRLCFPRCDDEEDGDGLEIGAVRPSTSDLHATVLLVEDEPGVLRLADRILTRAGCRVLVAEDGDEALEVAHAHGGRIDLVVTDVVMPGLDVRTMVERLRGDRPGIGVLYMSGFTDDVIAERGLVSGDLDLLSKPFRGAELLDRVAAALSRP